MRPKASPSKSNQSQQGTLAAQTKTSRRFSFAFVIYISVIFLGGALLAPWLYALVKHAAALFDTTSDPFQYFVQRSMPIVALLALWPLMRGVGFKSVSEIGLVKPSGQWQKFLVAFFCAFIGLALISGIVLVSGAQTVNEDATLLALVERMAEAVLSSLFVAVIEETIFRGTLLSILRRILPWPIALTLGSAIFAILHFMPRPEFTGPVAWYSGFDLLLPMLSGLIDFQNMIPVVFSLFLAAMIFGIAYDRTGNLYFSIGLHSGAVVWIKLYQTFTTSTPETATWFWGTGVLIDGWFAVGAFLLAVAMFAPPAISVHRSIPAVGGVRLGRKVAVNSVQFAFLTYIGFLSCVLLCSFLLTRWLTERPDPPDGRPDTERLASRRVNSYRELHSAAHAVGLIPSRRLAGVIDA